MNVHKEVLNRSYKSSASEAAPDFENGSPRIVSSMSHCPSVFVVLLLIYDLFPFWQNTQPDGGYFANIQKEAAVARYIDDFDKKFWSGGLFLILSVWAEFASKTSSFLIFVGVVCLDRWIVMFFVAIVELF